MCRPFATSHMLTLCGLHCVSSEVNEESRILNIDGETATCIEVDLNSSVHQNALGPRGLN